MCGEILFIIYISIVLTWKVSEPFSTFQHMKHQRYDNDIVCNCFHRPLFSLTLVTVWVIVSASLLVLIAVLVFLKDWLSVGLLVFSRSIVMFVEGEPISDISAVTLWENNQKSPAPIPEKVRVINLCLECPMSQLVTDLLCEIFSNQWVSPSLVLCN